MSDAAVAAKQPPSAVLRAAVRIDVLLMTANPTEAAAANERLALEYEGEAGKAPDILPYKWGYVTSTASGLPLSVALVWLSDDLGMIPAYSTAKKAIERLHPKYFIVLGIAAGVATNDVKLRPGDIVYSRFVRTGPIGRGNSLREAPIHQPSPTLVRASESLSRHDSWRNNVDAEKWQSTLQACGLQKTTQLPKVVAGEVVSKDGFVAPFDPFVCNCVKTYPKLAAFDMETGGVGRIILDMADRDRPPGYIFIKGISDNVYDRDTIDEFLRLTEEEREKINKEERERWKPFASHASVAFAYQLLCELPQTDHISAHPDMLWCPPHKPVEVNTGCIGVYTAVEPEAYSALAARLLKHVALEAPDEPHPNDFEHFFTVCAYSPRSLWDAIVQAALRQGETADDLEDVYRFAMEEFPHFRTFIEHAISYGSGVRILLLEDFRTWLPREGQDASRCTLPEHWKLFLKLNGYDENGSGKGIPFWGIDREALLRARKGNRCYRFLTDYVFLGSEFLLDYYDDAGVLIASEGARNSNRCYFMDLYELFLAKRDRNKPFKPGEELHAAAQDAFRQMGLQS